MKISSCESDRLVLLKIAELEKKYSIGRATGKVFQEMKTIKEQIKTLKAEIDPSK